MSELRLDPQPYGEDALRFAIPEGVDRAALSRWLRSLDGALDVVCTETHGVVIASEDALDALASKLRSPSIPYVEAAAREHLVSVDYDGADLEELARSLAMSVQALIELHSSCVYRVSFLGFLPGFAYLRGLPHALAAVPRRSTPRTRVPPGSVAMAGGFTGIYPWPSPGGWHLLGTVRDFAPFQGGAARFAIGDTVRFVVRG